MTHWIIKCAIGSVPSFCVVRGLPVFKIQGTVLSEEVGITILSRELSVSEGQQEAKVGHEPPVKIRLLEVNSYVISI